MKSYWNTELGEGMDGMQWFSYIILLTPILITIYFGIIKSKLAILGLILLLPAFVIDFYLTKRRLLKRMERKNDNKTRTRRLSE